MCVVLFCSLLFCAINSRALLIYIIYIYKVKYCSSSDVTTGTSGLPAAASPYWIIPAIAVSISSLGVAMVMAKTKIINP